MTENKRYVQFEFPYDDFAVKDNKTNEELWNPKIIDRLNEQEERVKELESCNHSLAQKQQRKLTKIIELEKENKQLQIEVLGQSEEIEILSDENKRLRCINKQLEERLDKSVALDMSKCGDMDD